MSKRSPADEADSAAFDSAGAHVIDISLQDEVSRSFLEYSYSVITSRALPDARDGLKPVHRRILFSMIESGLRPDHAHVKSARIVGDCFVAGTLVSTPMGLRAIESLEVGDSILDPEGQVQPVVATYLNPADSLVRVTWSNGHTMDVTPGQLFRVVADDYSTSWVRADQLADKRTLALGSTRAPRTSAQPGLQSEYAYVQGLMVSEGFQAHRTRPADGRTRIHMVDAEPIARAVAWAEASGQAVKRSVRKATEPGRQDQHVVTFGRNDAFLALTESTSEDKFIPAEVMAQRELILPFLAGYFDGDGYVRKDRREIVFVTTSNRLARDLYSVLSSMGLTASYWRRDVAGESSIVGLTLSGRDAQALAQTLAPWVSIGYKQQDLARLASATYAYVGKQGFDRLPGKELFAEFTNAHLGGGWYQGVDGARFRAGLGNRVRHGADRHGVALADRPFQLERAVADGWVDKLSRIGSHLTPRLGELHGYHFLDVVSVEAIEPRETYDIQVGSSQHLFVAEGLVVHNCMGKYHPHGDTAIYDAMVRMSQDFALNTPLIDGHGNFGSPNDGPAAMRYTESRLAATAMLMVSELDEGTVDFVPNYDGSMLEPAVMPAQFPNLLVNGSTGIAVGMATNMIPHNLGEVVAAARLLIKNPGATLDELMALVPGPDLPGGGMLLGLDEVRKAYEDGRGAVRIRARAVVEPLEGSRGRMSIVVTELPYGSGTERIIEKIKDEIAKKRLQGIADVKDLSDRRSGVRLVIECKTGVNPQALVNELYKYTPMESSFGIANLALVDGQPKMLGLKDLLEVFLAHRYEVVTRRTQFRLDKAEARKHIVDGLLIALNAIDEVVKTIRASKDTSEARSALMAKFNLSDIQTGHILDMPLRRLVSLEVESLKGELADLLVAIAGFEKILGDRAVLLSLVDDELAAVSAAYATPRRTTLLDGDIKEVLAAAAAESAPIQVADDPCEVILSVTGLLARTAAATEESKDARAKNGRAKHDAIAAVIASTARAKFLAITNKGRAFKVDVLTLPALPVATGTMSVRGGMPSAEVASMGAGERVIGIAPLDAGDSPGIALGTRQGVVKVAAYDWPLRSDEFEIMGLKDGDEIVSATWLKDGSEELVFISSDSSLLHFPAKSVRPQGRTGSGMAGIGLASDAQVVAFAAVSAAGVDGDEVMVVTFTGASAKVTPLAAYPGKGRATGGVRSQKFLKDEMELKLAWVGPRPAACTALGEPLDLPAVDPRRDASGGPSANLALIGAHVTV